MVSAPSRRTLNVPTRLMSMTLRNSSRSCGPVFERTRPAGPMPAQLTTIRSGRSATGPRHGLPDLVLIGDVGPQQGHPRCGRGALDRLRKVESEHRRALGRQCSRRRAPEAGGGASDDGCTAADSHDAADYRCASWLSPIGLPVGERA